MLPDPDNPSPSTVPHGAEVQPRALRRLASPLPNISSTLIWLDTPASFFRPFSWAQLRDNSCAQQLRCLCFSGSSQESSETPPNIRCVPPEKRPLALGASMRHTSPSALSGEVPAFRFPGRDNSSIRARSTENSLSLNDGSRASLRSPPSRPSPEPGESQSGQVWGPTVHLSTLSAILIWFSVAVKAKTHREGRAVGDTWAVATSGGATGLRVRLPTRRGCAR